jgi:large subunit ribosomal protein L24
MKIKKGDKIEIITGKDKGKTGKVLQISQDRQRVVIEGLNLRVKNVRARRQGEKGQQVQFPAPLHISNVMLVCPKCSKKTRVGFRLASQNEPAGDIKLKGKKFRQCRKCQQLID